jgi:glyoxylate reductase
MRVLYHSRTRWPEEREAVAGVEWRSLDALLAEADVVSLHCPLSADTDRLLDRRRLALIRSDAVLINTARGGLVDEGALIEALSHERIGGAGLDVFANEPEVPAALLALETVVALPHKGSATEETRVDMGRRVVANLDAYFTGVAPPDRVA